MGLQTALTLYPVNSTIVDSGTGISIRLLDSAQAGATNTSQSCDATHTQDNVNRTFIPTVVNTTAVLNPGLLQKRGWALRLSQDMTPTDDTNCNAIIPAGTASLSISVSVNQSGGTYVSGTTTPLFAWGLFKYDPATDTGTSITSGNLATTSWDATPVTGDLGTFKTITMSVPLASAVEFADGEILLLQIGFNTQTIPNPTVGTATWTYTLAVDDPNTRLDWASNQGIKQVCSTQGASSGSSTASGVGAFVLPTQGAASGSCTVSGEQQATANMQGAAAGSCAVSGTVSAVAHMQGAAAGTSTVAGTLAAVADMEGSSSGTSSAAGVFAGIADFLGAANGSSIVSGALQATADMQGSAAGTSTASGSLASVSETTGNAAGTATAAGALVIVKGTVGTVEIGAAGSSEEYPDGLLRLRSDGRIEAVRASTGSLPAGTLRMVEALP